MVDQFWHNNGSKVTVPCCLPAHTLLITAWAGIQWNLCIKDLRNKDTSLIGTLNGVPRGSVIGRFTVLFSTVHNGRVQSTSVPTNFHISHSTTPLTTHCSFQCSPFTCDLPLQKQLNFQHKLKPKLPCQIFSLCSWDHAGLPVSRLNEVPKFQG